eukprot:TRINITY_DN56152_c0_g1_i1.p1 TRINITY_DN56152_c0_g1~~TRINITY_DN56152_c0_g1_i1.p1  ORF type:complete len:401 (-),score=55.69 TRINITY_DN56152_c0_g1_i1:87-1289(-)
MAIDAKAEWKAAVSQLDFLPKDGMTALALLEDPLVLVLRTLQAVVAVLGLCPGASEDIPWSDIKRHLVDTPQFLSKMASFDADSDPARVKTILTSFFESEDFRPRCVMVSSVACAHLCAWCLALLVYSGGARPSVGAEPMWPVPASKAKRPASASDEEAEDDPDAGMLDSEVMLDGAASGVLRVRSGAGEVVATIERARPQWTIFEVRRALKTAWPAPQDASAFGQPLHDVLVGDVRLTGRTTLADLGADPSASGEGAEVLGVIRPYPEMPAEAKKALQDAERALGYLQKIDIKELNALRAPPRLCLQVCQAVYAALMPTVLDPESLEWDDVKEKLFECPTRLMKQIKDYDFSRAPELVVAHLQRYQDRNELDAETMRMRSGACVVFVPGCKRCTFAAVS